MTKEVVYGEKKEKIDDERKKELTLPDEDFSCCSFVVFRFLSMI